MQHPKPHYKVQDDEVAPVKRKRGRPKGSRNKKSAALRVAKRKGVDPLEFMLDVMNDDANDIELRIEAAGKALPYCHPRLAQITHDAGEGGLVFKLDMVRRDVAPT